MISEPIDTLNMVVADKDKLLRRCQEAITLHKTYIANGKVRDCELYSA